MSSGRALTIASHAARLRLKTTSTASIPKSFSTVQCLKAQAEIDDPDMNGGYINPPAIKRSTRDPYGSYTHKQQRRDFGEPVHEDNDVLGVFSLEDYKHMTPARGGIMWLGFISCVLGLSFAVYSVYPDRPSAPKEYPNGLEEELGGPVSLRARKAGDASV